MPEDSVHSPPRSIWGMLSISFVAAGCAAFLLFCLYKMFRNRCPAFLAYRRRLPNENDPEDPSLKFRNGSGLAADVVVSLESIQYMEEEAIEKGDGGRGSSSECAICLTEFGEGEWLRVLPNCAHAFHVPCIDSWLCSHFHCPLCRKQVLGDFGDSCSGISVAMSLETLPREGTSRVRPLDYHQLRSETMRNYQAFRSDDRGMRSLMWL